MVDVTRTFEVAPSQSVVVDYLKDFAHATRWDPGTQKCDRIGDGAVQVGSRWHNVSKFWGRETELDYELVRLDADRLVFKGTNKTATSIDDISVESMPSGSRITYHAHIDFHGIAKLIGPLLQREFERLGVQTEKLMTSVLADVA